jgi:DNA-binding IclR family transcriptional regulator
VDSSSHRGATAGAQAVDRAASLLVLIVSAGRPVTFPDLVSATGLPKSTVSRLLSSLERNRLISRTDDGDVAPGGVLTAFARAHSPEDDLIAVARPYLERVGQLTGETINLAVPSPTGVVQIDQVDARFLLGAINWLDLEVPYHASASGKVLLAHGVPLPQGRLTRLTDRTLTTRPALDAALRTAARNGYAVADGELEPGLLAVSAAVLGPDGVAVAAISVSGPAARLNARQIARIGSLLVTEARSLSAQLSRPPQGRGSSRKVGAA